MAQKLALETKGTQLAEIWIEEFYINLLWPPQGMRSLEAFGPRLMMKSQ